MSEVEIAYFAGILDVLGVMELREHKRRPCPWLEVRDADRRVLDELARAFGGNVCVYRCKGKPYWFWRRTFSPARAIVETLRPHLKLRTDAADRILRWRPAPPGHRRNLRPKAHALWSDVTAGMSL